MKNLKAACHETKTYCPAETVAIWLDADDEVHTRVIARGSYIRADLDCCIAMLYAERPMTMREVERVLLYSRSIAETVTVKNGFLWL